MGISTFRSAVESDENRFAAGLDGVGGLGGIESRYPDEPGAKTLAAADEYWCVNSR